jgi:hypothetical protein
LLEEIKQLVQVNKSTSGYGGISSMYFYDDNGDGKFETYLQSGKREDFAPRIPEWIQKRK